MLDRNLTKIEALCLFALLSLYALVAFGVNVDNYLTYNVFYSDIFSQPEKFSDTSLEFVSSNRGMQLFTTLFNILLINPRLMLLSGVILNICVLYLGYVTAQSQTTTKGALISIVVIGVLIHGYFPGFSGSELDFSRKAVVGLALIGVLFSMSRDKYFLLFLLSLVGILLHPLNMVSGLAFLLPGYVIFSAKERSENLKLLVVMLVGIAAAAVLLYYDSSGSNLVDNASITEWYKISLMMEVGDVAFFDSIRRTVGINGVVIILAAGLSLSLTPNKQLIDYLCMSFVPLILGVLVLEGLHYSGLSIPTFSEVFIGLQLRRGLWIISLVSFFKICCFVYHKLENDNRLDFALQGVILCAMLVHSIGICILGLIVFFIRQRFERKKIVNACLAIGVVLLCYQFIAQLDIVRWAGEYKKVLLFVAMVCGWVVVGLKSPSRACIMTVAIYGLTVVVNSMSNGVMQDSWRKLASLDNKQSFGEISAQIMGEDANTRLRNEIDVILAVNKMENSIKTGLLFPAVALGYAAPIMANQRIIFSRWDNSLMFKKSLYSEYQDRLQQFGVSIKSCTRMRFSSTACIMEEIGKRIDDLGLTELIELGKKYNFSYVVRKKELELVEVYSNGEYYVYKLPIDVISG